MRTQRRSAIPQPFHWRFVTRSFVRFSISSVPASTIVPIDFTLRILGSSSLFASSLLRYFSVNLVAGLTFGVYNPLAYFLAVSALRKALSDESISTGLDVISSVTKRIVGIVLFIYFSFHWWIEKPIHWRTDGQVRLFYKSTSIDESESRFGAENCCGINGFFDLIFYDSFSNNFSKSLYSDYSFVDLYQNSPIPNWLIQKSSTDTYICIFVVNDALILENPEYIWKWEPILRIENRRSQLLCPFLLP